jgi:hypothetical protein
MKMKVQKCEDKNKEMAAVLAEEEGKVSEMSGQIAAPNNEKNKLADTNKHVLQGKLKINL